MCKEDKDEVQAIGWQAIDDALKKIYKDQEPKHYGTMIPYFLGGNDPLQGISAYERKEPIPHWHIVTYGFSELYEKEWEDPDYSGYGFELTFRVKKQDSDTEPPNWALNFLQNIARYVFSTGNYFKAGHYLNANGPIAAGTDSLIGAIAFVEDPELPSMDTQNGRVEFLQVVGITVDEEDTIKCWNSTEVLKVFSKYMPLYITDLNRDSLLNNEEIKILIEKGAERDGSSTGTLFNDKLSWKENKGLFTGKSYEITIGAHQAETIGKVLKGRILKDRPLTLIGKESNIIITYSKEPAVKVDENDLELMISKETALEIASELIPKEKSFTLNTMKKVKFNIEKTEIRDQEGKVVQVIG
ncbi:suppressor of fused domain protein [Clostridium aciditolerans]|uniref:Suppressor of fused domain protein n=1 Tax=Clostridium aciditolerans TaxID=339861 RepID=A0A934M6P2_9CLOT|nr:suppressor of fused domain protein [Clostridium aciditolerans]MBI6874813.1 suppressor of fused domain protein [Clostridium aciditolerans]